MLRVVLDTNVYISAFNFGGQASRVLELVQEGLLDLAVSEPILREIEAVLRKKFLWTPDRILAAIDTVLRFSDLVPTEETLVVIAEDPDDNRILECALAASASIIVTGDNHLLKLKTFQGIRIMRIREFLGSLGQGRRES